jgi:hypothetical protein
MNSRKVVYGVGGQAIQSSRPERMDRIMLFFMRYYIAYNRHCEERSNLYAIQGRFT